MDEYTEGFSKGNNWVVHPVQVHNFFPWDGLEKIDIVYIFISKLALNILVCVEQELALAEKQQHDLCGFHILFSTCLCVCCTALLHLSHLTLGLNFQISFKEAGMPGRWWGDKENMDYILIKRACWVKGWCTSCGDVHLYFPCKLSFFFSESSLNWQLKECKNKCPISCCSYKIFHYFRNIMYQS